MMRLMASASPTDRPSRRATLLLMWTGLAVVTAAICIATVAMTHGTLTYIIDDTYIHLTMARNFAEHSTWGMVPGEFESSSSSPGWVMFLGIFVKAVPAIAEWWPLIINAVCCMGILAIFAYKQDLIAVRGWSMWRIAGVLLLPSVLFLPGLIQLGMEHSLHTLLVLILLLQFERMTAGELPARRILAYSCLLLAITALRLESAFLALGMGLVLVWPVAKEVVKRHFAAIRSRRVVAFTISGLIPAAVIGTIGYIDLSHGQYFLPNSIVEKTQLLNSGVLGSLLPRPGWFWQNISQDPFMIAVILFGIAAIAQRVRLRQVWIAWLVAALLHATYAQFGWYERYQAYLLIAGVLLTLRTLPEIRWFEVSHRRVTAYAMLFAVLPLIKFWSIYNAPSAAYAQYAHQNQTGQFLARYYNGQTVMINDIGHVTWLHSGGLVDMWALGSFEVLKSQHDGYYNSDFAARLAAEHDVAVVAEASPSFDFFVPKGFVRVADWRVGGGDPRWSSIAFWAPNQEAARAMRRNMQQFVAGAPAGVISAYFDTGSG
jgi:hypothetical protein